MREEGPDKLGTAPAFVGRHQPRPPPFDPAKLRGLSERLLRSH